jgi:hypothetical protein
MRYHHMAQHAEAANHERVAAASKHRLRMLCSTRVIAISNSDLSIAEESGSYPASPQR